MSAARWVVPLAGALALGAPMRAAVAQVASTRDTVSAVRDGAHDFDFEVGVWTMHRCRLGHPSTGSLACVDPGPATHLVRLIWGGAASLGEFRLETPAPHFVGSLLKAYNPASHQWSIWWVSRENATVSPPLIGAFEGGRGLFFDQEIVDGRTVFARVTYREITATSFKTERAHSRDGGVTWEIDEVDTYTRQ